MNHSHNEKDLEEGKTRKAFFHLFHGVITGDQIFITDLLSCYTDPFVHPDKVWGVETAHSSSCILKKVGKKAGDGAFTVGSRYMDHPFPFFGVAESCQIFPKYGEIMFFFCEFGDGEDLLHHFRVIAHRLSTFSGYRS